MRSHTLDVENERWERTAPSKYSQLLLAIAKTEVERTIETDEVTATAWMNQQLKALDIKLE
jgi:hypothetical protein